MGRREIMKRLLKEKERETEKKQIEPTHKTLTGESGSSTIRKESKEDKE